MKIVFECVKKNKKSSRKQKSLKFICKVIKWEKIVLGYYIRWIIKKDSKNIPKGF